MRSQVQAIPAWQLYGEASPFPDVLHIERIVDRASGLDWTIAPHRHLNLHQLFVFLSGDVQLTADGAPVPVTPPALASVWIARGSRTTVAGFPTTGGCSASISSKPLASA